MEKRYDQMNEPKRMSLYWLLAVAFVVSVVVFDIAYGDEGHGHHHDDSGDVTVDNVLTGGDNTASNVASIAGSRSYGVSGSDMDIGQCVYHVGGLTVAVGLRNKFCEGMEMIRSGMVDAGVLHICKQTKIGRNYDTLKDCKDGLVISYGEMTTNDTEKTENDKPVTESDDEDDNRYDAVIARMTAYEGEIAEAKEDTRKARIEAQRATTQAQTAQTPDDMADRRARARLAMKGEE